MKRNRLIVLLAAIAAIAVVTAGATSAGDPGIAQRSQPVASNVAANTAAGASAQIARGAYLARAGDCVACHTARGGKPYSGGRAIATPYGNIFSPNITPDAATGIGSWTSDDFWRALHDGKSKDGTFLYPAFPFPNYTKVTRDDADAIFAYLAALPPVKQSNRAHELRFPYNQRVLLAGWRALYFRAGVYTPDQRKSVEWNRGAYLVQGLGHCNACHTGRTTFGGSASNADMAGGLIPMLNWYAPSLASDAETGLGNWEQRQIAELLHTGVASKGAVFGPMAEVVAQSLQHLSDGDIQAMAAYLKLLPQTAQTGPAAEPADAALPQRDAASMKLGAKLYDKHCAACHQSNGQGYPPAYPPLAANRALTMPSAVNVVRMVLNGGYPPATGGNPRPYGMPPFGHSLTDIDIAAIVSYTRNSWGNHGAPVAPAEVGRYRGTPLD